MSKPYVTVEDFASVSMTHRCADLYNPPALTNFLGTLQAARDVLGLQHLSFPPFSQGDVVVGILSINQRCVFASNIPVTYRWRPDCILRSAEFDDLRVVSRTVMGVRSRSAAVRLTVTSLSESKRTVRLRIRPGDGVVSSKEGWKTPYCPKEKPSISVTPWEGDPPAERGRINFRESLPDGSSVLFQSQTSRAVSLQTVHPKPDRIAEGAFEIDWTIEPGEEKSLCYWVGIGPTVDDALRLRDEWLRQPEDIFRRAEEEWNQEVNAAFTPGNDRYSGHLPRLITSNKDLKSLYLNSVICAIYHKRETGDSAYGRTYTVLMPRYWVTTSVINDWSFAGWILASLDPACVRRHVEMWLQRDINKIFGTEYVSGTNTGNWYSCNDYAMTRLISCIIRLTGDFAWLATTVGGRMIMDHVRGMALHASELDRGHGVGDYGERNSLLECVGSYTNEVASLNAAAVWTYWEAAAILEHAGGSGASDLRDRASALLPEIQKLYVEGKGYWNCRRPDGTLVPVRHAWDFVHVLNFIRAGLSKEQVEEMVAFFERELMTPSWMHALSPLDDDVDFSLRPDHEWNGCWTGWVAAAGSALRRANRMDLFCKWLPGLAKTSRQGPFSQAHFVESYLPPEEGGGAAKAPTEWPFITDWGSLVGGAFFETILGGVFGIEAGLDRISARPALAGIDESASLEDLSHQGSRYRVDRKGLTVIEQKRHGDTAIHRGKKK